MILDVLVLWWMNVQEVMSPTTIVGNAAIASVDWVYTYLEQKLFFFQIQSCLCKSGSSFCICGQENSNPVSDAVEEAEISQGWQSIYTNGCVKFVQPNC